MVTHVRRKNRKKWGEVNEELTKEYRRPMDELSWSSRLCKAMMENVLELWQIRNQTTHGNKGTMGSSEEERRNIQNTIRNMYKHVKPLVLPQDLWLFQQSERIKLEENPKNQIAWIDAVERTCEDLVVVIGMGSFFRNRRIMTF